VPPQQFLRELHDRRAEPAAAPSPAG